MTEATSMHQELELELPSFIYYLHMSACLAKKVFSLIFSSLLFLVLCACLIFPRRGSCVSDRAGSTVAGDRMIRSAALTPRLSSFVEDLPGTIQLDIRHTRSNWHPGHNRFLLNLFSDFRLICGAHSLC